MRCDQPHEWEVTGTVDLTGRVTAPPQPDDDAGWDKLVGAACSRLARAYLGHAPYNDLGASWEPIEPGSWAAGRRIVECTLARYRNREIIATTGSLRPDGSSGDARYGGLPAP